MSITNTHVSQLVQNTFSFLHLNVQSIVPKIDMKTAEYTSHDTLSFTESWLHPHIDEEILRIPSYRFPPYRHDRPNRTGGGVVVYVKDTVYCTTRPDLHVGELECLWHELRIRNKKYFSW